MYTYQLQPRVLRHKAGESTPEFPCSVELTVELDPEHVLGGQGGSLPIILIGSSLEMLFDGNTGRTLQYQKPHLERIQFQMEALGGTVRVDGSTLSYVCECSSLADVANRLELLRLTLPAIFSLFLSVPVSPKAATANLGGLSLRSEIARSATPLRVVTQELYEANVRSGIEAINVLLRAENASLLAAVQYLHVAQRLGQVGYSPWEFTAEILLNCAKSLEALFGDRDATRVGTKALGYDDVEIEDVFVALLVLRNELDVGHAKVSEYTQAALEVVYNFVAAMPLAIDELLHRAIKAVVEGSWAPREARSSEQADASKEPTRLLESMARGEARRTARILSQGKATSEAMKLSPEKLG